MQHKGIGIIAILLGWTTLVWGQTDTPKLTAAEEQGLYVARAAEIRLTPDVARQLYSHREKSPNFRCVTKGRGRAWRLRSVRHQRAPSRPWDWATPSLAAWYLL